jgi:hypothetical protein
VVEVARTAWVVGSAAVEFRPAINACRNLQREARTKINR